MEEEMDKSKLEILRSRFRYKADKLDSWKIFDEKDDIWEGDCDDYAVTACYLLSDKNMWKFWWNVLTGKAMIWMVWSPGGVLHARLRFGNQWTCNIWPGPKDECGMKKLFPFIGPHILIKMALGKFTGR